LEKTPKSSVPVLSATKPKVFQGFFAFLANCFGVLVRPCWLGAWLVTSEELLRSWKRTEGFLRDARSHFSGAAEGICADDLRAFEEYLEHNELELALDMLEDAFDKSEMGSWRVLELMALAAASMGLIDRQQRYDRRISVARGWRYETILSS
jgi:hypothetical protein